jgi:hypothetical protein
MNLDYLTEKIIEIVFYPKFTGILFWIRFVFLAVSFFFLGFIFWSIFKLSWLTDMFLRSFKEFFSFRPLEKENFQKKWLKIKNKLHFGTEAEAKLAVLEGMELIEEALKWQGYKGKLEEILKEGTAEFSLKLEDLQFLDQTKDNIISDPDLKLNFNEREKIITIFKKILSELDILE